MCKSCLRRWTQQHMFTKAWEAFIKLEWTEEEQIYFTDTEAKVSGRERKHTDKGCWKTGENRVSHKCECKKGFRPKETDKQTNRHREKFNERKKAVSAVWVDTKEKAVTKFEIVNRLFLK